MADKFKVQVPPLRLPGPVTPAPPPAQQPPDPKLLQSGPITRTGSSFELALRRPILLVPVTTSGLQNGAALSCVPVELRDVSFGFDARFRQSWNLTNVTIGDLASTMGLAPREQLTLEFQSSQRKVLDQSVMDSTEELDTSENLESDKEAVNVTRASTRTEGWHVDGSATVSCGYGSAELSAGYSKNITDSNQQTINGVHEATKKSAHNLKTLHTITVRGVTEGLIQNRMTRSVRNPYHDRTIAVNVFETQKHFSVSTEFSEMRAAVIIRLGSLKFDSDFVSAHAAFLRDNLIDQALLDELDSAVQGARPVVQTGARDTAVETSRMALRYLFDFDNIPDWVGPSNLLNLPDRRPNGSPAVRQNSPQVSFNGQLLGNINTDDNPPAWWRVALGVLFGVPPEVALTFEAAQQISEKIEENERKVDSSSGWETATRARSTSILSTLAFFNGLVRAQAPDPKGNTEKPLMDIEDNAMLLAVALAQDLDQQWKALYPDPTKSDELQIMMSSRNFTEVFRRLPGFLAVIRNMVHPLIEPAASDSEAIKDHAVQVFALNRLIHHLECNSLYYTERFGRYLANTTHNQAIVEFAMTVFDNMDYLPSNVRLDPADFDFDRATLIQRDVLIPGVAPLDSDGVLLIGRTLGAEQLAPILPPVPMVDEIIVPCDGVHLEVSQGVGQLPDVEADTTLPATLTGLNIGLPPN